MGLLVSNYENKMNVNTTSGTLTKTYKDSYFVRFNRNSRLEDAYFNDEFPYRNKQKTNGNYEKTPIVILQVMLISDSGYIVEAIDKEQFDKLFEE